MDKIQEELSRRNKPSAIKKKKTLDAALERLKKKRALKEGNVRYDKLVKAIKQSTTIKDVKQHKKLSDIANKVKGIREMVSKMRASDYRSPGKTYDIKSKEVKDNQLAKREPNKGSALANRGTKNTEVKDKREPKPYSSGEKKEKKKFRGPSKERIGSVAKGIHNAVKSAGSAVSQGYGQSSWK